MLIAGIILIVVGGLLVWNKKRIENKILNIKYFDRIDLKTAVENYNDIVKELGAGNFSQMVKLSAKAESENPLTGEFSGDPCVYYESEVVHKYKVLEENKDSEGKITRNWVTRTETVGDTTRGDEFSLNDGSGKVDLNIQGADLTVNEVVDNFKPATGGNSFSFSFGGFTARNDSGYQTIGYSEIERNIGLGTSLFVIGEINDRNGRLMISKPADGDNPFIVSVKTEASMIKGLEGSAKMSLFGGIAAAVIGAGLIIASFFQ